MPALLATQPEFLHHGTLMAAGWGILTPADVLVAGTVRDKEILWFQLHHAITYFGLLCALAAWGIALVKFGPINYGAEGDDPASSYFNGMLVMVLGTLQPLNAISSPTSTEGDQYRWLLDWVHWTSGRAAWFGGFLNTFICLYSSKSVTAFALQCGR